MKRKTSWKKGQSGNPKGRPDFGWSWAETLRRAAEQVPKDKKFGGKRNKRTFKELAALALMKEAAIGNVQANKELGDRMDGKAVQPLNLEGESVHWYEVEQRKNKQQSKTAKAAKAAAAKKIKEKKL